MTILPNSPIKKIDPPRLQTQPPPAYMYKPPTEQPENPKKSTAGKLKTEESKLLKQICLTMKHLLLTIGLSLFLAGANAQHFRCSFSGPPVVPVTDEADTSLEVDIEDAVDVIVEEIIAEIGLNVDHFWAWPASNVRNFQAEYNRGEREYTIYYSFTFLKNLYNRLDSDDKLVSAIYVIAAHEIGHHLNGHVHGNGGDPDQELAADYFAGKTAARHGISYDDAVLVYQICTSVGASDTHPGREDRIEALHEGYTDGM